MKRTIIFADVFLAVLFSLFFGMQIMHIYVVVECLLIFFFLLTEVIIVLFAPSWYTPLKWLGIIFTVSVVTTHLPGALVMVSINHYKYIALLIAVIIVASVRIVCSFLVKHRN